MEGLERFKHVQTRSLHRCLLNECGLPSPLLSHTVSLSCSEYAQTQICNATSTSRWNKEHYEQFALRALTEVHGKYWMKDIVKRRENFKIDQQLCTMATKEYVQSIMTSRRPSNGPSRQWDGTKQRRLQCWHNGLRTSSNERSTGS